MTAMSTVNDQKKRTIPALAAPSRDKGAPRPDRAQQAQRAREARELGASLRRGKMKSFQPVVGVI